MHIHCICHSIDVGQQSIIQFYQSQDDCNILLHFSIFSLSHCQGENSILYSDSDRLGKCTPEKNEKQIRFLSDAEISVATQTFDEGFAFAW